MSSGEKIPYTAAAKIAKVVMDALRPHCTEFIFAGSLRRKAEMVGDIEVVCIPKLHTVSDLFRNYTERVPEWANAVYSLGRHELGDPTRGRRVAVYMSSGSHPVMIDIYMPQPSDFGRILAIRTGNGDFSKKLAKRWVELGWRGTDDGLRQKSECAEQPFGWVCTADKPTLPPNFYTEREFFAFLGWEYVEPRDRK